MTLRLLLITYVIGGLTFLPLLALTTFAILWYWSPIVDKSKDSAEDGNKSTKNDTKALSEGAASTTFAVLRRYDFVGATAALKDANNTAEKSENGENGQHGESISVYQSMYRTVFDRNRNAVNPLQENEDAAVQKNKARAVGKVYYIVLRHGHLMLYDSAVQFEVRHVISLAHYSISLQDDITANSADFLESDVLTRRTAIVLTPLDKTSGKKPYFLFGDVNIEKEDFYHALLSSIADPPIPRALETESMIKLQSALHSNSLTPEAKALNALLSRVFLALHRTPFLESFIRHKIETKMARTPKPAFIASIACHSLDVGDAAPILSNIRLKDINIQGETVLALDLKYTGGVNITIAAAAKLDLGPRFKTRMVSLLLAVVLRRLQGKMLIKIKPPPSNRIWFCFETMPDMELKIEPVVSSRQITYAFVLRAIETRIREVFAEGLVKPNWDDIPFFATEQQRWRGGIWETEGVKDVVNEEEAGEAVAEAHPLSMKNDKSSSMPTLSSVSGSTATEPDDLSSVKRRSTATLVAHAAKVAAEKAQAHLDRPSNSISQSVRAPKSLRSPSYASSAALVAVDDASADALPANAAVTPTRRRWIGRNAQAQMQKRDAVDAVRQVHDRDTLVRQNSSNEDLQATILAEQAELDEAQLEDERQQSLKRSHDDRRLSLDDSLPKSATLPPQRSETDLDSRHLRNVSTDSAGNPQRKTILASTAAATAAARQWTWNAVANRAKGQPIFNRNAQKQTSSAEDLTDGAASSQAQQALRKQGLPSGPIGRGQPLPPPGKPLPGPAQKGIWSAAAAGLGNMRRKPLPVTVTKIGKSANSGAAGSKVFEQASDSVEKNGVPVDEGADASAALTDQHVVAAMPAHAEEEGEFGPWMTNDSNEDMIIDDQVPGPHTADSHEEVPSLLDEDIAPIAATDKSSKRVAGTKKQAPPLPHRTLERKPLEQTSPIEDKAEPLEQGFDGAEPGLEASDDLDLLSASQATIRNPGSAEGETERPDRSLEPTAEDATVHQNATNPINASADVPDASDETVNIDHGAAAHDSQDDLSEAEDLPGLDDEVQAIPAPVDAETEESGVLNLAEDDMLEDDETDTGGQQQIPVGSSSMHGMKDRQQAD